MADMEETDSSSASCSSRPPTPDPKPATPEPPVTVSLESLTAHHKHLEDALTKGPVTDKTDLATLHKFDPWEVDDPLYSVTHVSKPSVRCTIVSKHGTHFPPSEASGNRSYDLHFRFNKLMYAPCARLECSLKEHTLILEFHFSDCGSKQLFNFNWQDTEDGSQLISFEAKGATCEGFNTVVIDDPRFSRDQKSIYKFLKGLVTSTDVEMLQFRLHVKDLGKRSLKQLRQLRSLLPGGDGPTIPSIGVPEYSCYPSDIRECSVAVRKPHRLINRPHPPPMVALQAGDTFSSLAEFAVQHTVSVSMQHFEGQTALRSFARANNQVTVYRSGRYAVIAMKFGEIPNTGTYSRPSKIRLPKELEIDIHFDVPGKGVCKFKAHLESQPLDLPDHDALFIIADHRPEWFGEAAHDPTDAEVEYVDVLELEPHYNSFLFESQLEAIEEFLEPSYKDWHTILLNQLHAPIKEVDVTAGLDVAPDKLADALKWLRECQPWNEQQLKLINSIHSTRGRLILGTGMAGSGQGTLNLALAIFCVKLGGSAIITGATNSSADATVHGIEEFEDVLAEQKLRIYRVYTGARKVRLQDMTAQQASLRRAGHQDGNVAGINSLRFEMLQKKQDVQAQHSSLTQGVLKEADKGELSWPCFLRYRGSRYRQEDAWDVFRECLEADRDGKFNWKDNGSYGRYKASFEECKRHLLSIADILICTNGNVRCLEIQTFAKERGKNGLTILGVFSEEAGKEVEANLVNLITAHFPRPPDLYVFHGDERQLGPVNTCAREPYEFNPFNKRLDTSLLSRLIRQGFPHIALTVQERLHPALSKFPGKEFYDGLITDSAKVQRPLEAVKPGFARVLHEIIAAPISTRSEEASEEYLKNATDDQARLHYIELPVSTVRSDDRNSIAVPAHIDVFFRQIFPPLQSFFGEETEKEVMLIVAYGLAVKLYERVIFQLAKQQGLEPSHYPRVLTIDAAQSHEATMVVFDGSMQYSELPEFLTDPRRCNAAMTRATDVFWIIGGPLEKKNWNTYGDSNSPFVKLKREMGLNGQVHGFDPSLKPDTPYQDPDYGFDGTRGGLRGRGGSRGRGEFRGRGGFRGRRGPFGGL
ncbi:hypothetical protein PRZ48_009914 [Zasmidium cellare]|uniref:DNA2/NAM7 helicase-like C-terminal domain-containing protein n=1 Tax=Zasmidium cellare TaxID=395010 RepID=A0ABR0ED26_ZASCE|nr:hypothetical protein PRZ48_009914 [Zasmidium cellare]